MTLRRTLITAATAAVALLSSLTTAAQQAQVPVQEAFLDNGMKILMVERHDSPTVTAGWLARVGSVNEEVGATGIAHLFEHMMFKGSPTIGTSDYEAEVAIMAQLDAIRLQMEAEYELMREAKRRGEIEGSIYLPENQTGRLAELRGEMLALQEQQAELIVKDEFDQIYTEAGGAGMNAGTWEDGTFYFVNVPANKLELWFWMESERLLNPVFREFYSERDVVREERRVSVESNPTAKFEEQYDFMFWGSLPYHHPVVGWPSDVESISRDQAEEFFATYYAPNNITAALVGDFDPAAALALAKKYFGRIPRGAIQPPPVVTEEIEQLTERRMIAEADANPSVQIRWHTVPFVHKDLYAIDVMDSILAGRTGRLYKSLVEALGLATGEPYSYHRTFQVRRFRGNRRRARRGGRPPAGGGCPVVRDRTPQERAGARARVAKGQEPVPRGLISPAPIRLLPDAAAVVVRSIRGLALYQRFRGEDPGGHRRRRAAGRQHFTFPTTGSTLSGTSARRAPTRTRSWPLSLVRRGRWRRTRWRRSPRSPTRRSWSRGCSRCRR